MEIFTPQYLKITFQFDLNKIWISFKLVVKISLKMPHHVAEYCLNFFFSVFEHFIIYSKCVKVLLKWGKEL